MLYKYNNGQKVDEKRLEFLEERLSLLEKQDIDSYKQYERDFYNVEIKGTNQEMKFFRKPKQEEGYDGFLIKDTQHDSDLLNGQKNTQVVAIESNQIKSATDNIGTFDSSNPSILF